MNEVATHPVDFRQYQAPRGHAQTLIEPSLSEAPQVLADNVEILSEHGDWFAKLRASARLELIDAALRYTSAYRDTGWVARTGNQPIIMAGHQPALFHGGVWFKNFALSQVASQLGAVAINLIVDNDVASTSSIRVPVVDPHTGLGSYRLVSYDRPPGGVPYEQTTIRDRAQFDQFDRQVSDAIRPLVTDPCVGPLWGHARAAIARCGVAGCALAQARHGLEGDLGLQTLELPLGVMCRSRAFAEFVFLIVSEIDRFQQCYNQAANHYRAAHRIRSTAHPVPDLAHRDGWYEAPLWIYGDDRPHRRAAWIRREGDQLLISDWAGCELRIDRRYPNLAAEQLAGHASPNFKLRPRALLTTMYARLVLSDLFLHGIGGGKYDQLGDLIIRDFFAVEPPNFMVISATVQLPGAAHRADHPLEGEVAALKRQIRDCHFQGERFAGVTDLSPMDVQQKQRLLREIPPRGERRAWQRELEAVNRRLADQLVDHREGLADQLVAAERQAKTQQLLSSREHPFCLFPLEYLTETYRRLLSSGEQVGR